MCGTGAHERDKLMKNKTARPSYAPFTAKAVDGLAIKEAAKELGMHPETLRRLIREKRVRAQRSLNLPGHGYAITHDEIRRIKNEGLDFTKVVG